VRESVCYVSQVYHPENVGVACWVPERLAADGWDVRVLTGVPNYPTGVVPPGYDASRASREMIGGIPVRRTPLYPSHDDNPIRRILNYTSWALSSVVYGTGDLRDAGLAVVYSTPVTANLAAMWARIRYGVPYVTMIQDLWPDSVFASGFVTEGLGRRLIQAVMGRFAKLSYDLAAHVTVLSPSMKDVLVERGVDPAKISLVYNWVDEALFAPGAKPDPALRDDLRLGPDDFVVMYAGAMGMAQGLTALLDGVAITRHPIHLVMVGDGIDRENLERHTAALGIGSRVHFLGRRPMASMPGLLAAADVQAVCIRDTPLFRVNMPSKVQSLLAAGHPIVAVAVGDPAGAVLDAGAGWAADPANPTAVAAVLDAAAEAGTETLRRMGAAGRRSYETLMSAEIGSSRLGAILRAARTSCRRG
jgi:glycosyltransferase involved in cell wall biosynthesis